MNMSQYHDAMSSGYWSRWNADVQRKIDRDIEENRKADATFNLKLPQGTEVSVELLQHAFIFGAHIFNFDQLGTDERNRKYKALFGTLFNSATIAFYWYPFEPTEGRPRFVAEPRDTADYWNMCADPNNEPHWRRPATDPVVAFCESKGIRLHGHPLVWSNSTWHYPRWLLAKLPKDVLVQLLSDTRCGTNVSTRPPEVFAQLYPEFADAVLASHDRRIREIATRYGNRIHSWDVCNESLADFEQRRLVPGARLTKSTSGTYMPGDYCYRAFQIAQQALPENAVLNINDYILTDTYVKQTLDLIQRDCRVDIMGAQMHLFNPQTCRDIADGTSDLQSPQRVWATMETLARANRPIHLSEITIAAPDNDASGQAIQAVIAHNLYRLWFSIKPIMGITWWNVVDGCGAPGEPSESGLFSRDMAPKPAYEALQGLINGEWKTQLEITADQEGAVSFRGFRGTYRLSWQQNGQQHESTVVVR